MKARSLRLLARGAPIVAALLLAASTASADDADTHFKHGVDLYKDSDFAGALVEFQRAYQLDPRYQVLYNIGEAEFALQDHAGALKTFQRYLFEAGNRLTPKRRRDVERDIEKLRQRVASVTVRTSEQGAKIAVDDVVVGTTPLAEPVLVSAGRRRITATMAGRLPVTQVLDVAGGDQPLVSLNIAGPDVRVVTLERPPLMGPILAWSATGVALTAAVVTGVLALGASNDLKSDLAAFPGNPSAISSAHGKTQALAAATDVLGVLTAAGAGVAIYLTVRLSTTPPAPASPASGRPSARIVVTPSGLGLAGSF